MIGRSFCNKVYNLLTVGKYLSVYVTLFFSLWHGVPRVVVWFQENGNTVIILFVRGIILNQFEIRISSPNQSLTFDVIAQVRQLAQAQLRTPEDWAEIRRLVEMQFGERFNMIFNT